MEQFLGNNLHYICRELFIEIHLYTNTGNHSYALQGTVLGGNI